MNILITGAGGYLGVGLIQRLACDHTLRVMDIRAFDTSHELFIGDVTDLDCVRQAVDGMDAVVIAHMASRQPGTYNTPTLPFDINVKGTANLFAAAVEQGITRFVLISSGSVVTGYPPTQFKTRDMPMKGTDLYGLSKVCQEVIAEQYQRMHQLSVSALRIGWVMDSDSMIDKYGTAHAEFSYEYTDPRDIGDVAGLALARNTGRFDVFYVYGAPEADQHVDAAYTREQLGWTPRYDFAQLK